MRNKILFALATLGILLGVVSAYVYSRQAPPQPPLTTNNDPYTRGIFANGIIESYDANGENINIYPQVAGRVTAVDVTDGQTVAKGAPLFALYDRVQQEVVAQNKAQVRAAQALLEQLRAEPRPETLAVAKRQVAYAQANLVYQQAQLLIIRRERALNPQAVSLLALKNAENSTRVALENLRVARAQYNLTKAGAWIYDIRNQQAIYEAAKKTYASNRALLRQYIVRAPVGGRILRINVTNGSYASPQGVYGTYTQGMNPAVVMGRRDGYMQVRAYLDEILVPRLPSPGDIRAEMFIRGFSHVGIPLQFVRIQPYVTPKVELSNQRTEKVDVRVLPIIFRFKIPSRLTLFPGELVDVYIGTKAAH
ncbi:MAG: biotin/lipoyl-binding protein [Gammaproteobacteria bacterium]|nr:biotin/lipoyl-binding protein [Gammaproteobacteria bacterium]